MLQWGDFCNNFWLITFTIAIMCPYATKLINYFRYQR